MIPGLKQILLSVKTSYLPALILGIAALYFCGKVRFQAGEYLPFHMLFYILIVINAVFVLAVGEVKPLFHLVWITAVYLAINNLSLFYGTEALQMPEFQCFQILLPLNWLYFAMSEKDRLNDMSNFYSLCFILLELALIENSARFFNAESFSGIENILPYEWAAVLVGLLLLASRDGSIKNTGVFFAYICLGIALLNKSSPAALCLFFGTAALILFITSLHSYIYTYIRDNLTGVYSRRMFAIHARKSFPLKFSIGVICLDDYTKLLRVFGLKKVNSLLKMIINKIHELDTGGTIYRYNDDEFIIVFKNEDKKQSYEYLENIRRTIAGAEFVLNRKQILKVTISAGVSEKKRSDTDVNAVLERTREVLQKAYKFAQNITSKA